MHGFPHGFTGSNVARQGTGDYPPCVRNLAAEFDLDQRFTLGEVERITGTTRRQLEYWSRLGLVHPRARWGERFFNFTDLVAVETLNRLAARRVPARRLRRAMDVLEQRLGRARAELATLRISTNGAEVVVHEPGATGGPIEPLTGQFVLNFETAAIERKVRALHERTAEEWFEMGMAMDASASTHEDAIYAYQQAIAAAPEWVEAYINLGTTLFQVGRIMESQEAFSAATQRDPGNALAHFNLGCAKERLGDTPTAIQNFRTALSLSPRMADAHLNIALAYERTGAKADALNHFSLYLQYEPQGPWADFARTRIRTVQRQSTRGGKVTPFRGTRR
jgi:tetratricopeptide (TPR) repeat protein